MINDLISRSALLSGYDVRKVTEYDESGCGMNYKAVPVEAIEKAPAVDAVSPVVYEQVRWERDVALDQLNQLGCDLGMELSAMLENVLRKMIERKTVSQCVSEDYCKGWNDAATGFERFHRLREKTFAGISKALEANDGYGKSYEGAFEITQEYPNFYDDPDATSSPVVRIKLHCYILGPARHYEWSGKTFAEALAKAEQDITTWAEGTEDAHENT